MRSPILLATLFLFIGCTAADPASQFETSSQKYNSIRLLEELRAIDMTARVYSDDSSNWPYFKNPRVVALYTNPSLHLDASLELWRRPDVPIDLKKLAARLLQCVSLAEYLALTEAAWLDVKRGLVPPEVLETLVAPGSDWGTQVELSYRDPTVARLLGRIAEDASSTEKLKATIAGILSGEAAEYVRAYDLPTEPLPRLSCTSRR